MKLFAGLHKLWVDWRVARRERASMIRTEQELRIRRELEWLDSRRAREGTHKVLTSSEMAEAVSNEFFRRHHS